MNNCPGCGSPEGAEHGSECPLMDENSALHTQIGGDHYAHFRIQPAEFITANDIGFLEGCIIKRMCRHESKNGIEDLEKAKHEIDLLIELRYLRYPDMEARVLETTEETNEKVDEGKPDIRHQQYELAMSRLDELDVPRFDPACDGAEFSLWGRMIEYINRAEAGEKVTIGEPVPPPPAPPATLSPGDWVMETAKLVSGDPDEIVEVAQVDKIENDHVQLETPINGRFHWALGYLSSVPESFIISRDRITASKEWGK